MGEIVTVNFRGDDLYGFKEDDGVFVALKPIVEAIGLAWNGQFERVNRDPVLSKGVRVMRIPFGRGGAQEATCLKMERLNGWLFGIDSGRIKDTEVRERIILYQEECYDVLYRHFTKGRLDSVIHGEVDQTLPMNDKRKLVVEARQTFGHVAARELWIKLGMPTVDAMFVGDALSDQPDLPGLDHANDSGDEYKAA